MEPAPAALNICSAFGTPVAGVECSRLGVVSRLCGLVATSADPSGNDGRAEGLEARAPVERVEDGAAAF